jgi:uncharacterized protein
MVGDLELLLDAGSTAADTAWIATLQDIDEDGTAVDVTAGCLRASLRGGVIGPPRPQAAPSSA